MQLPSRPVARPPLVLLQLLQQFRHALAELRDRLDLRLVLADEAVDAAVLVVAVRIALTVLHVADQRVGPVAEPQRAVGTDLRIGRAEVLVGRTDQVRHDPLAAEAGAVVLEREPRHAVHGDDRGIDELPLHLVGQVSRNEPFATEVRPLALVFE